MRAYPSLLALGSGRVLGKDRYLMVSRFEVRSLWHLPTIGVGILWVAGGASLAGCLEPIRDFADAAVPAVQGSDARVSPVRSGAQDGPGQGVSGAEEAVRGEAPADTGNGSPPMGLAGSLGSPVPTPAMPPAGADPQPQGADAALADMSQDSAASLGCTPVDWDNPGAVPNPKVVFAGMDNGLLFAQKANLDRYDYVLEEFFFSGTAPTYTTRMVVRRPRDPAKFSGTVFMEWYNVSASVDIAVIWADSQEYFMRSGHAFVAVSAQAAGVNTLRGTAEVAERYEPLDHPGDAAANTIFSQAGAALRTQSEMVLGPCMAVERVLAVGQALSGFRLASYIDDVQAQAQVYDGFFLHSSREPSTSEPEVPVMTVMTMSEGNGRRVDADRLAKWPVAGATHTGQRVIDRGGALASLVGLNVDEILRCENPLNSFPAYRAYNAALDGLERWVREGQRPSYGPRFETSLAGELVVDEYDNAIGGVRLPELDVPIATYGFDNAPRNPLDVFASLGCGLGGTTLPFSADTLRSLYPTHEDYVRRYRAAADRALAEGFLLQQDYDEAITQAEQAPIPE